MSKSRRPNIKSPPAHNEPRAPSPTRPAKPSFLLDTRVIYCGDNLEQLAKLPDASIDLIYIDPPFNSNRNYEVFWGETKEKRAFEDRRASTQPYIDYVLIIRLPWSKLREAKMSEQLLSASQIPATLWARRTRPTLNEQHLLILPPLLREAYESLIDDLGLRNDAEDASPTDDGPQGGISESATRRHFGHNFSGSCARIQLVMLDPLDEFKTTRDLFVQLFAGGHLLLLDIPCGAGAASATLLALAAELRANGIVPRIPLRVDIVGGDISPPARKIKRELMRKLKPRLKSVGITATSKIVDWDIQDADKTSELVSIWITKYRPRADAAILALNFSGFLSNKIKECKDRIREILRYGRSKNANVVWIEPATNAAIKELFPGLKEYVFKNLGSLKCRWNESPRRAECRVSHPIKQTNEFTARACAMHLGCTGD
ncbi:MAG TPA: hypothetical protein VHQ47_04680 [Phycisphaerae bacterium]|nr:hypothetical protein [Phycisphaerae bacterium]